MKQYIGILLCGTFASMYGISNAAEEYNVDKEIARLKKEISSIETQRKTIRDEVVRDEKEYAAYTTRAKNQFETIRNEIDSIQQGITSQTVINDSLSTFIATLQTLQKQTELQQNYFRDGLIAGCDKFLKVSKTLPPMITKTISVSLSFLRSELIAKNIDNTEGIQRLTQIIKDIEETTGSIQVVQGASPFPEIRGTSYQIRMGVLFEAVVNTEGTTYALWDGYEPDGNIIWKAGNDPVIAEQLLKCVNVREGKALPAFIELPLKSGVAKGVNQ